MVTADSSFGYTRELFKDLLGLSNQSEFSMMWLFQYITNNFIHLNIEHLITNISLLIFTINYENKVGVGRYFIVFIICSLAASLSVFAYNEPLLLLGASGGTFGLLTATILDGRLQIIKHHYLLNSKVKGLSYLYSVLIGFCLISFAIELESNVLVNHVGHFLGVLAAIIYILIYPSEEKQESSRAPYLELIKK